MNILSVPDADSAKNFYLTGSEEYKPEAAASTALEEESLIKCFRCGGPVEWYEKQTRSADEAITQFCTCKKCGHKWRQ